MPKGDRTGPDGHGPKTGRQLGYCNGYDRPGCEQEGKRRRLFRRLRKGSNNQDLRSGRGRGWGDGRGSG